MRKGSRKATKTTATKTTPTITTTEPTPDPEAAAARVLAEDAAPVPRSSAERQKAYRERKKAKESEADAPIEVGAGDVMLATRVGDTLWRIAGPMFRLRPLNEAERQELGEALAPLVVKYMPLLGRWQYEAGAIICVMGLAQACYVPKGADTDAGPIRDETTRTEGDSDDAGT